ncbi:MAG TPA: Hsp20/alpha crystallin family protein [Actinomycetota bacterium]|nr:Hsp20/alpha crystallin family protein [Actinomycetota bacterium]
MNNDAEFLVRVQLPHAGLRPDVDVSALDSTLDVRVGYQGESSLVRSIPLPTECGDCGIQLSIHRGVLEVRVPVPTGGS